MSDDRHVVLAFSLGSKAEEAAALLAALQEIAAQTSLVAPQRGGTAAQAASYHNTEEDSLSPGDISTWNNFDIPAVSAPVQFSTRPVPTGETQSIALEASAGRLAAEMVIPYPPGIPLLYPGEHITESVLGRLLSLREGGAKFQACADPALQHIRVYNIQKGGEV